MRIYLAAVCASLVIILALSVLFSSPTDSSSVDQNSEASATNTVDNFPELLSIDPGAALEFARRFDASNPSKIRTTLGLYERLLSKIPADARAPLLVRIEELNQSLADQQGAAFQKLEEELDALTRSGKFNEAVKAWEESLKQFHDEDLLGEIRENIRACKAQQRRLESMLRCSRAVPSNFTPSSADQYARRIGPLLQHSHALRHSQAYKDLSEHATRLKKYYRTQNKLVRIQRLEAAKDSLRKSAAEAKRALEERQALIIERTKNYQIPYKSGIRIQELGIDRFRFQFKRSGRERIYSFQDKPELTAKVLQFARREKSLIDLVNLLCFCLEHKLFTEARDLQKELVSLSSDTRAYRFDLEKLERVGDDFRGEPLPEKKGIVGARYNFQSKKAKQYLEDWTTPADQECFSLSPKLGLKLSGLNVGIESAKFFFNSEVTLEFPAPGPGSSRCRVELRLDRFGRDHFYVAAEFDPSTKTCTLTRGQSPLEMSPMTGMVAFRRDAPFKLHVKDGKVTLEHGSRKLSCAAQRFTNCRVAVYHLADSQVSQVNSSWAFFTIAGALADDWSSEVGTRFRRAIDLQILAIQSALVTKKHSNVNALSVDDPLTFSTVSEALLSHYKRAWSLLRDGQSEKALREFNLLLRGNGRLAGAHYARGLILQEKGQFDDALQNFEVAVKIDALFPEALAGKAQMLARTGRTEDAIKDAQLALALWPDCADAHGAVGLAAFTDRHFEDALKALKLAQHLQPRTKLIPDLRAARHVVSGPPWGRVYESQSKNFIVRTDASQAFAAESVKGLERAQAIYKEILGVAPKKAGAKQLCLIFGLEDDFRDYTKYTVRRYKHSNAGLYSPRYRCLLFYIPSGNNSSFYRFWELLYHEGFHAYADSVLGSMPVWLNEGLAQVSEKAAFHGVIKNKSKQKERIQRNQLIAKKRVLSSINNGGAPTVLDMLTMPYDEFHNRNELTHYSFANLICQFMLRKTKENIYRGALQKYIERIRLGDRFDFARQRAFADLDFKKLNNDFQAYVRALKAK